MLRREAELSQSELAEALNVSVQSVSKWECDSNMPDVSLLLPIASVLGVTTDCLLGAGTNEAEDLERLKAQLEDIELDEGKVGKESKQYRLYAAQKDFLKKYPLNYDIKLGCSDALVWHLYNGVKRKLYDLPREEFEAYWNEGVRMAQSVRLRDSDPQRSSISRHTLINYYLLKEQWDDAEAMAHELPRTSFTRDDALYYIAEHRSDAAAMEKYAAELAKNHSLENVFALLERARSISIYGNVRKREALAAWDDAISAAEEYERLFGASWSWEDNVLNLDHPKVLRSELLIRKCGDLLAILDIEGALDVVEQITDIALSLHREIKEKASPSPKRYADMLDFLRGYPVACYNRVIDSDDNVLTREERFKACRAKLDALE